MYVKAPKICGMKNERKHELKCVKARLRLDGRCEEARGIGVTMQGRGGSDVEEAEDGSI